MLTEQMKAEVRCHRLKTWPTYFDAVARGEKLFEVRRNDRFFQAGDYVELLRMERDDFSAGYSFGRESLSFMIGPVLQGGQLGIEPGFCVFSLLPRPETSNANG